MIVGIVEDNDVVFEMLKTALKLRGHSCVSYKTGFAFLEALQEETLQIDALVLDLLLPGNLSGEETLQSLYHILPTSELPIVIVTGAGDPTIQRVQQRFPRIPIMSKPLSVKRLIQLLEQSTPGT